MIENGVSKTFFPSLIVENDETIEKVPLEYDRIWVNELGEGKTYTGQPVLGNVETFTIDYDGEPAIKHRCNLYIVNHEREEYLQLKINLKNNGDVQLNIPRGSVLFDVIGSISKLEDSNRKFNKIKQVNLEDYRSFLNTIKDSTVLIIGHCFNMGENTYYSVKFLKMETKEK